MERLAFGNPRAVEYVGQPLRNPSRRWHVHGRRHQTPTLPPLYNHLYASCTRNDGKSQLIPIKKDRSIDEPVPEVNRVKRRGRQQSYTESFSSV